jgi:heterodisulfide reductase subunit C
MVAQHSATKAHDAGSTKLMAAIQDKILACMQCGTCTGSCANSFAMDLTPRQMWRLVQLGRKEDVFKSKTFFLCSACYYCTLRCPRGLPLTETINALKRLAAAEGRKEFRQSTNMYRTFMDTVQRYGRLREMEFMNRYFLSMKNPLFPLRFAALGLKLMLKGKTPLEAPRLLGAGRFDRLFRKVRDLEEAGL